MISFGHKAAAEWDRRTSEELPSAEPELTEGRHAYAAEHADTERRTCAHLEKQWAGIRRRADAYLEGTLQAEPDTERQSSARLERDWAAVLQQETEMDPITVVLDIGDDLDADKEEALLEDELDL
jgi:hypothetical protein